MCVTPGLFVFLCANLPVELTVTAWLLDCVDDLDMMTACCIYYSLYKLARPDPRCNLAASRGGELLIALIATSTAHATKFANMDHELHK